MRWLHSAILTSASLIPMSTFADEPRSGDPGFDDFRGRVEQFERELQFEGEGARRDGGGREPMRPGGPEGRRPEGPGGEGRPGEAPRAGGPGREGGPQMPGGPRAGGPGQSEDQMFQLRMRAREIEHQMQNLKWELETVHLQMEHLGQGQRGGPDAPRAGGPGREPGRREGMEGPGPDRPNGQNPDRRGGELRAKAEELRKALQDAEKSGDSDRAKELRNGLERLKNAFEEMERNREGGDSPKDRKNAPRADGEQNDRRAVLKTRIEEMRKKLERAEANGEERNVEELRAAIEKAMHDLTGGEKENVDRKRGDAMAKIERRIAEVEEQLHEAKNNGRKEVALKLGAELDELRAMAKKVRGEQGGGEKKPEKRPRMI